MSLPLVDDRPSTLPHVLRRFALARLALEPPPGERGVARELYPIRMTLALVAIILFAAQATLLWMLGEHGSALAVALGLPPMASLAVLLRAGWPRLAIGAGTLLAFGLQIFLHASYGIGAGAWLYSPVLILAAYQVYAPEDWPHRLLPVTLAVAGCMVVVALPDLFPLRAIDGFQLHRMLSANLVASAYAVGVVSSHAAAVRDHARNEVARQRDRADALLLDILPAPIARRLKAQPGAIVDSFESVSVLFADLVGFTPLAARLDAAALVALLNDVFSAFDAAATRHRIEKIKTIGDAYMLACGLPEPRADHAEVAVRMALEMQTVLVECAGRHGYPLALRIGIHSGPVVAGVIGVQKFAYDLWGDTVNTASRMESHGLPGEVHISDATRALLPPSFELEDRGTATIKGKGAMRTWFVRREGSTSPEPGRAES